MPGEVYGRSSGPYYHGLLFQPDCGSCPLLYDTKVYPDGPIPARVAFVGEEPGDMELSEGRGFVGPSGQLLWMLAEQAGLKRDDVWVTNSALCQARKVVLSNGAIIPKQVVKAMATKACRTRLLKELLYVGNPVVVPLGNWALWSLSDIPKARIYAYRGSRIDVDLQALCELVEKGEARAPIRQVQEA